MGAVNNTEFTDLVNKLFCCDSAAEEGVMQRALGVIRTAEAYSKFAADGSASATTAISPGLLVDNTIEITSVRFIPYGAVTADNTNNAVITVASNDGAGGAATTIASLTTNVAQGNLVAGTAYSMALTATLADRRVAGSGTTPLYIGISIAKGGTGVAVPAGRFIVQYVLR